MPARLFLSSGDLIADRRYDFARDLQLRGDLPAAADLLQQAVELAPTFASAWFTLGEIWQQLGKRDAAVEAFRKARAADPADRHGAAVHLLQLGAEPISAMPAGYVQSLFDQYAPRFENALLNDLNYRGPSLLFKAVVSVRNAAKKPAFFKRGIDLGCGTGLGAAAFAKNVDRFIGIDLSPGMIEKARASNLYAELEVADMVSGLAGKPDASADFVLAADAMVYVADIAPVLHEARRVLAPGGLIAFTTETHPGEGVILGEGLRYALDNWPIRILIVTLAMLNITASAYAVLLPIFAKEVYFGDAQTLGLLWGAVGLGGFISTVFLAGRPAVRNTLNATIAGVLISGIALLVFPLASMLVVSLPALAALGFGLTVSNVGINTVLQAIAPDHLRGRVVSFFSSTRFGFDAIGGLIGGAIATIIGAPWTLVAEAVLLLAVSAWLVGHAAELRRSINP